LEIGIGGSFVSAKRRAKIISGMASSSEEERRPLQAEKFDRLKVIKIDGGFIFPAYCSKLHTVRVHGGQVVNA
jgi:hypothetical protein